MYIDMIQTTFKLERNYKFVFDLILFYVLT